MQNDGFWEACKSFAPMMRVFFDNAWKILRWMLLSATGWTTVEALGWTPGTILLSIIPGTIGAFLAGSEFFSWVSQGVTEKVGGWPWSEP